VEVVDPGALGADPESEAAVPAGGDGVHWGRWVDETMGQWAPAARERLVEEAGLDSEPEEGDAEGEEVRLGRAEAEGVDDDAAEAKDAGGAAAAAAAARRGGLGPRPLTTARAVHPLGRLRLLSLAGNPLAGWSEVNRLRHLRGLASVNLAGTPVADEAGDKLPIEVLVRLGGRYGQRIRLASGPASGADDGGDAGKREVLAAVNVVARLNGRDLVAEDVLAAREERKTRVAAWREEADRRRRERAEARAEAERAAKEAEDAAAAAEGKGGEDAPAGDADE
jgi:hypothetical protein